MDKIVDINSFRCEHRHVGYEHRNCYKKYLEQTPNARIGFLDIETSNLNANFGIIYSWAIANGDSNEVVWDAANKKDFRKFPYDHRVTQSLIEEMKQYDILFTFYGSRFDIPYIRTRAMMNDIEFPYFRELIHQDLYFAAKMKMKLHSNRLAVVCESLGISGKTPIDNTFWIKAMSGDMESIDYIVKHNIADVEILKKFYNRIRPYIQLTKRSI